MDIHSTQRALGNLHQRIDDIRGKVWLDRAIAPIPKEAVVPLGETQDVLLLCSRMARNFDAKLNLHELALAHELADRGREFAVADDAGAVFEKSVLWVLPNDLVTPRLWDYSRQVRDFAVGIERQANRLLCSSDEVAYWENKGFMHRRFDEVGVPTPETKILTAETWDTAEFGIEPVLLKEEHSAGSAGVHHFRTAREARKFVADYRFRPRENLIMQEIVRGATKDLRLTMVGEQMIRSASFWRKKTTEALYSEHWTTTASKYGTAIQHGEIPEQVIPLVARYLQTLGLRMAGVDLIWVDDDVSRPPLVLEVSPYFQPNPRKPESYADWTYKRFKERPYVKDGYLSRQYQVFREIAAQILDQRLY